MSTLEQDKADLKDLIKADQAEGINGVGIDPFENKLVVFSTHDEKANITLQNLFGDAFPNRYILTLGRPATRSPSTHLALLARFKGIFIALKSLFPLKPASEIRPLGGEDGRVGCFVKDQAGDMFSLTAEHLFATRNEHLVQAKTGQPYSFKDIGKSGDFGDIQARPIVNTADCAYFSLDPQAAEPKKDNRISGKYVNLSSIINIEGKKAASLVPGRKKGTILDVSALIVYEVPLGGKNKEAIFDNQVLIKGSQFAQGGDSGSLAIMEETVSQDIRKGDAVGLISFVNATEDLHMVAPLFECFRILKLASIYQP